MRSALECHGVLLCRNVEPGFVIDDLLDCLVQAPQLTGIGTVPR